MQECTLNSSRKHFFRTVSDVYDSTQCTALNYYLYYPCFDLGTHRYKSICDFFVLSRSHVAITQDIIMHARSARKAHGIKVVVFIKNLALNAVLRLMTTNQVL